MIGLRFPHRRLQPCWPTKRTCIFISVFLLQTQLTTAHLDFTTNHGTITITGYRGSDASVVLPSQINGLPVTCIGTVLSKTAIG